MTLLLLDIYRVASSRAAHTRAAIAPHKKESMIENPNSP